MSKLDTLLVHGANDKVSYAREVNVPIYLTATFEQKSFEDHTGYGYARGNNPTRESLEYLIKELEGGKRAFAFASGMAATSAALSLFSAGDKVLVAGMVYGGTYGVLKSVFAGFGLRFELVELDRAEDLVPHITEDVKGIFFETPVNPTLKVNDIRGIVKIAKEHSLLTIVDNTFMSPFAQRPLELGVDVVVESATKYLGGHSDIIAGIAAVNDEQLGERLHMIQALQGGILQPFDAYQLIRSIKTLGVRVRQQTHNAYEIAKYLETDPAVKIVHYPGLESDPGYELQRSQADSAGAMLSFELDDQYCPAKFLDSLHIFTLGASLGGVESLIGHPATTSHRGIPEEDRAKFGISDLLIRVSPGIEDTEELIADLAQALRLAKK
ncbi:MAG: PLP-dependent aspartate aminotransferase family protein [Lachnospiraceae bacterium]|nr:PLP-dependent aspartate aminotransferase family protein [Lachnospiraceae bacterium]